MDAAIVILLESAEQINATKILIDSLRALGGELGQSTILLFKSAQDLPDTSESGIEISMLEMDARLKEFPLAGKVAACAQAEKIAGNKFRSMIWMNPETLVIKPPILLGLGSKCDLAIRPVHIQNIGLSAAAPIDDYWKEIYQIVGLTDDKTTVESFVDKQKLRAYYNTHVFSINPTIGLFRLWTGYFKRLALDQKFQSGPCRDGLHKIFLHQAVLSALIEKMVPTSRLRLLPPDYSYPYNLQDKVPIDRRAEVLNELTVMVYEQRSIDPDEMKDIRVEEPLRAWLGTELRNNH